MFKKFFSRFIRSRHYWRDINFDELSELYTSMMFRSLAMSLVGIFIPIYLYQLGYELWEIFFFYAIAFSVWSISSYPVARIIAKFGPKHSMLASYVFQVITMMMLVSLDEIRWSLTAIAITLGVSNALFFIAFHVDFSKVKHKDHGGKELGWMVSMQKVGAVLGPLVGGLIAFLVGAEYIFMAAIALLFIGIIPLFLTNEPTAINQKLRFDIKVKDIKFDLISVSFYGVENTISLVAWPLFIGIYVFTENPYLKLGSIVSISVLLSLLTVRAIGKTIDKNKGRTLLRYGASLNALLHLFRPFTNSYPYALGINLVNEAVTPAYQMPFTKAVYDAADDLPGRRIVYLTTLECISAASRATLYTGAGIAAYLFSNPQNLFIGIFVVGSLASLGIMLERFKALEQRK